MLWMKRWFGLGAAPLLGAMVLLAAPGAFAVGITPAEVYLLPSGDTPTLNIDQSWTRLHPFETGDPVTPYDYSDDAFFTDFLGGGGTSTNAWFWDLTFEVTWNNTINGQALDNGEIGSQLLFLIVDSRFEIYDPPRETYDDTFKLHESGFLRGGGFAVDGSPVTPLIVSDNLALSGIPVGDYPPNWIGFLIDVDPNDPTATHTITMQYALGEDPLSNPDRVDGDVIWFPNALLVQTVPEPGAAALMSVGMLILGLARRGRRGSA